MGSEMLSAAKHDNGGPVTLSEGSDAMGTQMLRCAQHDKGGSLLSKCLTTWVEIDKYDVNALQWLLVSIWRIFTSVCVVNA